MTTMVELAELSPQENQLIESLIDDYSVLFETRNWVLSKAILRNQIVQNPYFFKDLLIELKKDKEISIITIEKIEELNKYLKEYEDMILTKNFTEKSLYHGGNLIGGNKIAFDFYGIANESFFKGILKGIWKHINDKVPLSYRNLKHHRGIINRKGIIQNILEGKEYIECWTYDTEANEENPKFPGSFVAWRRHKTILRNEKIVARVIYVGAEKIDECRYEKLVTDSLNDYTILRNYKFLHPNISNIICPYNCSLSSLHYESKMKEEQESLIANLEQQARSRLTPENIGLLCQRLIAYTGQHVQAILQTQSPEHQITQVATLEEQHGNVRVRADGTRTIRGEDIPDVAMKIKKLAAFFEAKNVDRHTLQGVLQVGNFTLENRSWWKCSNSDCRRKCKEGIPSHPPSQVIKFTPIGQKSRTLKIPKIYQFKF